MATTETEATKLPTCVLLSSDGRSKRYRLVGGDLAPSWAKSLRSGRSAWCEISVWDDGDRVSSYGGEVWPSAWPALFKSVRSTAQTGGCTLITEAGRALLARASEGR